MPEHRELEGPNYIHPFVVVSETEPTFTLAGLGWLKESTVELKVRNEANTAWHGPFPLGAVSSVAELYMLVAQKASASHRHVAGDAEILGLTAFIQALIGSAVDSATLEMLIGAKAHASHQHYATEANLPGITAFVNALITAGTFLVDSESNILANQVFGA